MAGLAALLVAVIDRSFIAMMAVGNDQFLLRHRLRNRGHALRIGDDPQAMHHAVFVAQLGGGSCD